MRKIKVAAMGVEHRHIFSQLKGMLDLGCECIGWWNDGDNKITQDFNKKYTKLLESGGSQHYQKLLESFDLNPKEKNFWQMGMNLIKNLIDELEQLS